MTTNIHYLIAAMAVLLVVLWQYSRQRQMDDRNSLMFRRLLRAAGSSAIVPPTYKRGRPSPLFSPLSM